MKVVNLLLLAILSPLLLVAQDVAQAWQYATVRLPYISSTSESSVEATVEVCYHTDEGCRVEIVQGVESIPSLPRREGATMIASDSARRRALAKALSKLGKLGWEAVAAMPQYDSADGQTILLKARLSR
jgi:hypothetical protein